MDTTSTIKALRERCPSFAGRVFGAARFVGEDWKNPNPATLPAAYAFCVREAPEEPQRTETGYYQEVAATVRVVIAVENTEDARGQHGAAQAEALKDEVFLAILGWSPTKDPLAIYTYQGMEILDMSRAALLMTLDFESVYAIGRGDTRIPAQLEEECGKFDTLDVSVDTIKEPPGEPDGREEAHLRLEGLYGD